MHRQTKRKRISCIAVYAEPAIAPRAHGTADETRNALQKPAIRHTLDRIAGRNNKQQTSDRTLNAKQNGEMFSLLAFRLFSRVNSGENRIPERKRKRT